MIVLNDIPPMEGAPTPQTPAAAPLPPPTVAPETSALFAAVEAPQGWPIPLKNPEVLVEVFRSLSEALAALPPAKNAQEGAENLGTRPAGHSTTPWSPLDHAVIDIGSRRDRPSTTPWSETTPAVRENGGQRAVDNSARAPKIDVEGGTAFNGLPPMTPKEGAPVTSALPPPATEGAEVPNDLPPMTPKEGAPVPGGLPPPTTEGAGVPNGLPPMTPKEGAPIPGSLPPPATEGAEVPNGLPPMTPKEGTPVPGGLPPPATEGARVPNGLPPMAPKEGTPVPSALPPPATEGARVPNGLPPMAPKEGAPVPGSLPPPTTEGAEVPNGLPPMVPEGGDRGGGLPSRMDGAALPAGVNREMPVPQPLPTADVPRPTIALPREPADTTPSVTDAMPSVADLSAVLLTAVPPTAVPLQAAPVDTAPIAPRPAAPLTESLRMAVEAVASTLTISPELATTGMGEIRIQLKPDILEGSAVRFEAKGGELKITLSPATPEVAEILKTHLEAFQTHLAERVANWRINVGVTAWNPQTKTEKTERDE